MCFLLACIDSDARYVNHDHDLHWAASLSRLFFSLLIDLLPQLLQVVPTPFVVLKPFTFHAFWF